MHSCPFAVELLSPLLPGNRIRRATKIDRCDGIEKEKALARALPKHDEALRSFFLSLQDTLLISIGEEGNVIRRWYLVSLTASGHDSKWDKRRADDDLADFRLFRMHVDSEYKSDFSGVQGEDNIIQRSYDNQPEALPRLRGRTGRDLWRGAALARGIETV
jgi:hypothetical protein